MTLLSTMLAMMFSWISCQSRAEPVSRPAGSSVLAQRRIDLAGPDGQIYPLAGDHVAESLVDTAHRKQRRIASSNAALRNCPVNPPAVHHVGVEALRHPGLARWPTDQVGFGRVKIHLRS